MALAREHDIHIHESPELIEVLIRLELGEEIPEALYRAIAEVIAFAYALKPSDEANAPHPKTISQLSLGKKFENE